MANTNEQKWPGPKGLIPEPDHNAANANIYTRNYFDSILIEQRMIDSVEADIHFDCWNETYDSPIMMPAFSHLNKVGKQDRKPMQEYAQAARQLHVMNWVGMEPDEEYIDIANITPTVRIIKPFQDHGLICHQIDIAKAEGAPAVGIDIDHIFGKNGKYDVVDGYELGPITSEDLQQFVNYAEIPFVAKGVLSVTDARKCQNAGVQALFISHHHGRMPFAIPPLMVLPEIRKACPNLKLFVDCGINDGYDAFKALALGADAVAVGRGILPPLLQKGTEGVITKVKQMNEQLKELMGYTNTSDLSKVNSDILYM